MKSEHLRCGGDGLGGSGFGLTSVGSWLRGMPGACTSPSGQTVWGQVPEEAPPLAGKAPPSCPGLLGDGESWGVPDPSSILGAWGPEPHTGAGRGGGGWGPQRRGRGGGGIESTFQTDESALPQGGEGSRLRGPLGKVPGIRSLEREIRWVRPGWKENSSPGEPSCGLPSFQACLRCHHLFEASSDSSSALWTKGRPWGDMGESRNSGAGCRRAGGGWELVGVLGDPSGTR